MAACDEPATRRPFDTGAGRGFETSRDTILGGPNKYGFKCYGAHIGVTLCMAKLPSRMGESSKVVNTWGNYSYEGL